MSLTPTEEDYDDMHHALGRPDGRWVQPSRNYYVVGLYTDTAARFRILGSFWQLRTTINGNRDGVFAVTPYGVDQVMAWLELKHRAKGLRAWRVDGAGITARTIVARSASAAKHQVYVELSDVGYFDTYRDFVTSGIRARAA